MKRVLVIGCYIMGLGVIRALHLKNIDVVAMHYEKTDVAHLSRYASERVRIPHPGKEAKEFINFLVTNAHRWRDSLILPTDDYAASSVAKNKDILSRYYVVGSPDWDVLSLFMEKEKTYKLAAECGVPHPKTFTPDNFQELREIENNITYPCILKPVRSHEFKSVFDRKNFEVNEASELLEKFKLCLEANQPVLVQEIIPGPDTNIYKMHTYMNSQGVLVGKFFMRKLRSNPQPFGVARVIVSEKPDMETEELGEILLTSAGYKGGFYSIEFKKDPRDNKLKLMEVNTRMPRVNWLATSCGINFPWLIYMDLMENQQIDIEDYKENYYWIDEYADFYNAIFRHRQENIKFSDYLKPYLSRNKVYALFSLSDPVPFLKQTLRLPRVIFGASKEPF